MKFLAKMKEKQMQRKLSGILCGLLCAGVLVMPSAWADNYFGDDGKTPMSTGAKVTLNSGTYDAVYGGYNNTKVSPPEVFKNNVTITGTVATNIVCGAYSLYGNVRENIVTISGNTLGNVVCGGGTGAADAIKNHVIIKDKSEVNGIVYGGKGVTRSKENDVKISDSTIKKNVYGGYADNDKNGSAEKNEVAIGAGSKVSEDIYGGYATHNTNENKVSITNGAEVGQSVFGGFSEKADSKNNEVLLNGASGVTANIAGGVALKGNSEDNKVNIAKSTVNMNVYGGYGAKDSIGNIISITDGSSVNKNVYGGYSFKGNSMDNTVTIDNSTVNENVYGGYTESDGAISEKIQNNKVIFKNGAKIKGDVYGGYDDKSKANIINNTLEIVGKDNEARTIQNFDKLNFFITKDLIANDNMLKVTDTAFINNAEIKAGVELGTKLNENDKINLITAGALKAENITTGTLTDGLISIDQGLQVTVGTDGNKLVGEQPHQSVSFWKESSV